MKRRFICLCLIVGGLSFLNAEPDNGRLLPNKEKFSAGNIFFELSGNLNFPMMLPNGKSDGANPNTGVGGGFNFGAGYNWCGWMFGVEYTRDMFAGNKKPEALMDKGFTSNIFVAKIQRVLSKNTIKAFPVWLSVVPGVSFGVDVYGADYYKSKSRKDAGIRTVVPEFSKDGVAFYGRISAEASFYVMKKDYIVPFAGIDYNFFFDIKEKLDGKKKVAWSSSPRLMIGIRSYPWTKGAYEVPVFPASLTVKATPEKGFSPDGDGLNDKLRFSIKAKNLEFDPESWQMEILDPEGHLIRNWEGTGQLPKKIEWDGYDNDGKMVTSVNNYTAKFTAIPDVRDRERVEQEKLETTAKVRTGVIMQEEVPNRKWRVVASSLYFDADAPTSNDITDEQKVSNENVLNEIAEHINARRDISKVTVEGYANNVSNTEEEDAEELVPLSQARADAIVDILAGKNVKRGILEGKGMGGANPIAEWEDRDNWWRNRRVEFVIETAE